jgi:ADP-ribose pyrophosphatase YjhB (NUDIX family)
MKKERLYCPYCAEPVVRRPIEGKDRDMCTCCTTVFYENPLPVACAIVVNEARQVLLVKRKKQPYKDMWCLPIGFAESGEEVKDAALRELEEEAGIIGEIVRLIDVDTIDNDFYGSLAIVTYEVRATGGELKPGDDAIDAQYFPILDLPPLAWSSNEKAVSIFVDLYRDNWAMMDSFKQLFPDLGMDQTLQSEATSPAMVLSNILIKVIDKDRDEITKSWADEVKSSIPAMDRHMNMLRGMNKVVLQAIKEGLEKEKKSFEAKRFMEAGSKMRELDIPLPDILNALALSRKNIWVHVIKQRILSSPLEIYSTLELNNRIIFLYDKVNYYITKGYMG